MPTRPKRNRFCWVHVSDLQLGHERAPFPLGPTNLNVKSLLDRYSSVLGSDMREWALRHGEPSVLCFTGDLSRWGGGMRDVLFSASDLLRALVASWDCPVLAVPGNHDLEKRKEDVALLFRLWGENTVVREQFWSPESSLRAAVNASFAGYSEAVPARLLPEHVRGELPGDFSFTLQVGGRSVGIAGLNCVFNQIFVDSSDVGLLDPRQLEAVCGGDPEAWAQRHDLRILMTHLPWEKLDKSIQTKFHTEIAPPGRFQLHLTGQRHHRGAAVAYQPHAIALRAPWITELDGEAGYLFGCIDFDNPKESLVVERTYTTSRGGTPGWHLNEMPLAIEFPAIRSRRAAVSPSPAKKGMPGICLTRIRLKQFRLFEDFDLSFEHQSRLGGEWTCLAGVNGAGKSSIVQAVALAFLGNPLALELGGTWLERMRRQDRSGGRRDASVQAEFRRADGLTHQATLRITTSGLVPSSSTETEFWSGLRSRVCLAYGATRNLSPRPRTESDRRVSPDVQRQMTVFDPLSQLADAESILAAPSVRPELLVIFRNLMGRLFGNHLSVVEQSGQVRFTVGNDVVEAVDLPDGFRSSAAWLADLCATWSEKFPEEARKGEPSLIDAIVVIDEIDLHLHPSLQRSLIPKLREALPRVQWIVTTHSPLILSNFDSNEIVALDRSSEGGVRKLDRQILGFTTDQIYHWLMGTEPSGAALEQELKTRPPGKGELAEMLMMSPDLNAREAKERISKLKSRLSQLKS